MPIGKPDREVYVRAEAIGMMTVTWRRPVDGWIGGFPARRRGGSSDSRGDGVPSRRAGLPLCRRSDTLHRNIGRA